MGQKQIGLLIHILNYQYLTLYKTNPKAFKYTGMKTQHKIERPYFFGILFNMNIHAKGRLHLEVKLLEFEILIFID